MRNYAKLVAGMLIYSVLCATARSAGGEPVPPADLTASAKNALQFITGVSPNAVDRAEYNDADATWTFWWTGPSAFVQLDATTGEVLNVEATDAEAAAETAASSNQTENVTAGQAEVIALATCRHFVNPGVELLVHGTSHSANVQSSASIGWTVRINPIVEGYPINTNNVLVAINPYDGRVYSCLMDVCATYVPPAATPIPASQASSIAQAAFARISGGSNLQPTLVNDGPGWTNVNGYARTRALAYRFHYRDTESSQSAIGIAEVLVDAVTGEVWRAEFVTMAKRIYRGGRPVPPCPRLALLAFIAKQDPKAVLARAVLGGKSVRLAHAPTRAVPLTVGKTSRLAFTAATRLLTWRDASGWHGVRVPEASVAALKPFLSANKAPTKPAPPGVAAKVAATR